MTDDIISITLEIRQRAWQNGYRPIAILNPNSGCPGAGKRPAGSGLGWKHWELDARSDPPHAVVTTPIDVAVNTGILCDGLRPMDIDVDDPDLAEALDRLCVDMLGDAPMRWREDSPRRLRLYRAAEGEPRHREVQEAEATMKAAGRRKPWGVEVLGHGNQFVAFGRHPDGAFLDWRDGRDPSTIMKDQLPAVTEAQITEYLSLAGDLLGASPPRESPQIRQNLLNDKQVASNNDRIGGFDSFVSIDSKVTIADVQAAVAAMPGDGGCYRHWIRGGLAIAAATGGSSEGKVLFDSWSQKSGKYDPSAVDKIWPTFRPRSISFGTLVHLAREADPTWRAPSWSPPKIEAADADDPTPQQIATDILNRNVGPPPVMPLAVFGGGWRQWLQQAAIGANAPVDYVATSLLAVAGSLIGNARWAQAWHGWAEPPVLWCALVGEPSASKTPAAQAILKLLRSVEADLAEGFDDVHAAWEEHATRSKVERKRWEAALAEGDDSPMPRATLPPEPARPLTSTSSVTVEKLAEMLQSQPKGFLISNDELAGWLGNMERYSGGTDRPFWLTAWTGGSYRSDRKTTAAASVPCLALGVFGTIQPDRLAATLSGVDDGLPARFLFCWPDAHPFARPRGTVNVSYAIEALGRLARLEMLGTEDALPAPGIVAASDNAADVLTAFAQEMQAREQHVVGVMKGMFGKARGYVLRIALIFEFLQWAWTGDRHEPTVISAQSMQGAVEMMRNYFLPMASRILGDAGISQQERHARSLAKWIAAERPDKVNLRALSRGETGGTMLHGLRNREALQAAVEWLQDCGWFQPNVPVKKGGRPRSDYVVAPALWAALDDHACQNRQNRQKAAADVSNNGDGDGGFDSFVSDDEPVMKRAVMTQTMSNGSDVGQEPDIDFNLAAVSVAPTRLETAARDEHSPNVSRANFLLSIHERLMVQKRFTNT